MSWIRAEWDRVGAVVAVIAGAIALLVGYIRTSNTPFLAEQMALVISGALGGIFLLSVGAILWLSADMRDEWRELRSMSVSLETLTATLAAGGVPPAIGENGPARDDHDYTRSPASHAERSHA